MEMQDYIEQNKKIYSSLIDFLEQMDDDNDDQFQEIINIFESLIYQEKLDKYREILQMISFISNYHQRQPHFISRIGEILLYLKDEIKQSFSNSEIITLFQFNKLILLFLIKNEIIVIDDFFINFISEKCEKIDMKYEEFFYEEIKDQIDIEKREIIEKNLLEIEPNIFDKYEEKRQNGQNDSYLCELIRNDSIEEFVIYVNKKNTSLSSEIKPSIFETNLYLIKKNPTLIEYAAFYGSIQIFQFLKLNKVKLTSSLWLYSIHGRNPELIHLLEEENVERPKNSYECILKESIKCHHNEIANYIMNNFIIQSDLNFNIENKFNENIYSYCFHYYNYELIPNDIKSPFIFYYACQYNYIELVKILLKDKKIDINSTIEIQKKVDEIQ